MYYDFSSARRKRRHNLYKKNKETYNNERLQEYIKQASKMREKTEFDLPTRYYTKFDEILQNIITRDDYENEMPYSTSELKFIIYLLMVHIEETNYLYNDIDRVFERLSKRQKIEKDN